MKKTFIASLIMLFAFNACEREDMYSIVSGYLIPSYRVTYNGNGNLLGTIPSGSGKYLSGETVTVLGNNGNLTGPYLEGAHVGSGIMQRFITWNTLEDGTGTDYPPGSTFEITEDITLYAIYTSDNDPLRKIGPAGGYIFYHDTADEYPSWTYLESAPLDESGTLAWSTVNVTRGTQEDIGEGFPNTHTRMVATEDTAADVVINAEYSGFDDWFLPSRNELNRMYNELKENGLGGFADATYWSSTEFDASNVRTQLFLNGNENVQLKSNPMRIRAARAF